MKQRKKLVVAGVIAAVLAGGSAGAAMAADGSGHAASGTGEQTQSHRVAHKQSGGSDEKGLSSVTTDDGKPGLRQDGTAPNGGGTPDTYSYRAR